MSDNQGLYDPLPEEQPEATLQCAGCNDRLSASEYPPGVPCPYCRSRRRRLSDGSILPKTSPVVYIVIVDAIITLLVVLGLLYYFYWRNNEPSPAPPAIPTVEEDPGSTAGLNNPADPNDNPVSDLATLQFVDPAPGVRGAGVVISDDDAPGRVLADIPYTAPAVADEPLPEPVHQIPTISDRDRQVLDDPYEPFEFVQGPNAPMEDETTAFAYQQDVALHVNLSVDAIAHEAFGEKSIDAARWNISNDDTASGCQPYFTLHRDQLLVGSSGTSAKGPASLVWAEQFAADFEAEVDFIWMTAPADGQCGMYIECVDEGARVLASIEVSAWGRAEDARRVIFQCGSGPGSIHSVVAPTQGRLRIARNAETLEVALWNGAWQPIGAGVMDAASVQLRFSGYNSSTCPRYVLALDDLAVKQRHRHALVLQEYQHLEPAAATIGVSQDRPQVVSIRETPDASGKKSGVGGNLPHAMSGLPTGPIAAGIQNASSRDLLIGFRREGQGVDIQLGAGATKQVMIPSGEYTVLVRLIDAPSQVLQTSAFNLTNATASASIVIAGD